MFIVLLVVVALADYVITFCCIVNMVTKPIVRTVKTPEVVYDGETDQTMNSSIMEFVCDDEEFERYDEGFNRYIEEQNSRIALLSSNVNEILSIIDSIIERSENQRVVSL